ncbi:MAG: hypothetical protein ACTSRZ_09670 [Promethearchaeota archaeon]
MSYEKSKSKLSSNEIILEKKTILDDLEAETDEKEKFWKTPSSQRIVQGGSIMTLLDIIGSLGFTIYLMMLTQSEAIGDYEKDIIAVVDTLTLLLKYFAVLGFTGAGAKMMSEYLVRDKDQARLFGAAASKYNFLMTGVPLIAYSIYLALTKPTPGVPVELFAYICLVIMTIIDRLRSNINIYILAYKRYDLYAYAYYIPWGLQYIFAIFLMNSLGVYGVLGTFTVGNIVSFILVIIMFKKCSDFPLSDLFKWKKRYHLFKEMFSFNFLYALANLIFALVTTTLLISFGRGFNILNEREGIALYSITTLTNILINVFEIVVPIMVSISEAHSLKNPKLIKNYTMLCVKFPILVSVAVFMFYVVFGADVIESFFGARYIAMGVLILLCSVPSYIAGAFASRYDNIIAGIGRPEVVIIPWILTFLWSISGLFIAYFIAADLYIYNFMQYVLIDHVNKIYGWVNYGISARFAVSLGISSISLIIGGIWITKICLKVLGVKIPRGFLLKPLIAAVASAAILIPLVKLIPLKIWIESIAGSFLGGYIYIMLTALLGIIIYGIFAVIFDVLNEEDGRFWKKTIESFGPLFAKLGGWAFIFGKKLLKLRIKKFVSEPIHWITKTDKEELIKDQLFKTKIIPVDAIIERINKSKMQENNLFEKENNDLNQNKSKSISSRVSLEPDTKTNNFEDSEITAIAVKDGDNLKFKIEISDLKRDLHEWIVYARLGFKKIDSSFKFIGDIKENESKFLEISVPIKSRSSSISPRKTKILEHLEIIIECYEKPHKDITPIKLYKKGFWTFFDYTIRWIDNQEFAVLITV